MILGDPDPNDDHIKAIARGSGNLLAAIHAARATGNGKGPCALMWKTGHKGWIEASPDGVLAQQMIRRVEAIAAADAAAEKLRKTRDACPNCGVRGDIGCDHRR